MQDACRCTQDGARALPLARRYCEETLSAAQPGLKQLTSSLGLAGSTVTQEVQLPLGMSGPHQPSFSSGREEPVPP